MSGIDLCLKLSSVKVSWEPVLCSPSLCNFSLLHSQPLGLAAFRDMDASLLFPPIGDPCGSFRTSPWGLGFGGSSGNLGLPFRRIPSSPTTCGLWPLVWGS